MVRTITDIAKAAGVSKAAVSYVLNGKVGVGEATRNRILQVMKEMDFHPSQAARSLAGHRTGLLGLLIPDISDMFYIGIIRGMEAKANGHGYTINLCTTHAEAEKERRLLGVLSRGQTDGVAFMAFHLSPEGIRKRVEGKTPLVAIGSRIPDNMIHTVSVDNREVGRLATSYLLELGHRRIAFLSGLGGSEDSRDRFAGYVRALSDAGIAVEPALVGSGEFQREMGRIAAAGVITLAPRPTAIFAANDQMALGALTACQDAGLRVPEDISIIGVDDIEAMSLVNPRMTSVRQPTVEMGSLAAEILIRILAGEELPPEDHVLQVTLIERDSCIRI